MDGDTEGWCSGNPLVSFTAAGGSLAMESTGDVLFIISPPIAVPAADYSRIGIRMKVSPGNPGGGQVFFITDLDPHWDEAKSLFLEIIADGEFHGYVPDLSNVDGWNGVVTQLRFDPVLTAGTNVEVEIFALIE